LGRYAGVKLDYGIRVGVIAGFKKGDVPDGKIVKFPLFINAAG
jgi:hypothetical protein